MIALALLDRLSREDLSALAAAAIDRLDAIDGDPDREDDDPAGGNILDEPHDQDENQIPTYGLDQTAGIIDLRLARHYEAVARERGLERSPGGRWRYPNSKPVS